MYLKTRKYQVGGIAYTPYLAPQAASPQESLTTSGGATSSKSSSPEKISGTIKKEIIDLLKENGIPSDVTTFLNAANTFLSKSQSLSGMSLFGGTDDDYDLTDLIKVQQMVNDVKYNNALKDAAAKQLTEQMAGSEVALTDNGHLYVQDKDGKITTVSPEKYAKDKESYTPLTNNQLLYYREHDPGFAFNTGVLNDLRNTVGMKTITDYLKNQITAFGNDEKGGYATKDNPVARGMELLMAAGPDGYYKFKDSSQLRDVNAAIKYLYEGLTPNAKNLLRGKTAADGGDPNKMGDVCDLILQALQIFPDKTQTVDFDKPATEYDPSQTGKKGGSSSEKKVKDTYLYRVASLNGPRKQVMLAPKGSKIADTGLMVTMGITNGAVVDDKYDRLGNMSVAEMLTKAEAVKAADATKITLGSRILRPDEYAGVMFDSNQECNTVYLPYKYDSGQMVPDFDVFEKYNQLQRAISGKFNLPRTEVDRMARDLGLDSDDYSYDSENNTLSLTKATYFLTFGAVVGDQTIDLSADDKRFLTKLSSEEGENYKKAYDNMLKYGKIDRKKSDLKVGNYDASGKKHYYRGMLYMVMPDAYRGAHLSMDEYIDRDDVNNFGRRTELRQQQVATQRAYEQEYGNIGQFTDE